MVLEHDNEYMVKNPICVCVHCSTLNLVGAYEDKKLEGVGKCYATDYKHMAHETIHS
ncbi:hypothetical protein GCM10011340_07490 [Roseivirga thermotolerans]|uniref:Uncharacterized protein n=1 Tax=Roseivirga thermotolerans TaxID=1758176 RepID=A0ABQ3I548_9BACT|nr:hypothetical protein GCM10011340_07490 [Roseivirga thermotolerans]